MKDKKTVSQNKKEQRTYITTNKAARDFAIGLYLEHLEETSALYEQRLTLFDDPEITWHDIEDFDDRFEAHIDGLVVGEELALAVCKQQASEGDFGELHTVIRVFCRQNRKDLILEVLEQLDPEDDERVLAVSDALKYELPEEWQDEFIQMLSDGDRKLGPIIANLFGYRRPKVGIGLLRVLEKTSPGSLSKVIWALGRLGEQDTRAPLLKYLQHEDESIRLTTAIALLRLGEQQTINHCLQHARAQGWPLIPVGLGGNRSAVTVLLELSRAGKAEADCLIALGLLGDISAIEMLFSKLADEDLAESAAIALNLITGAEIYEDAFIPEKIDEDELFEEELEDFRKGKVPTRPDGEPFGSEITRISQKHEDWQNWWQKNKSRFNPNIRYRNGKPYSPECLLENLKSEKSLHKIRKLAYEELVIRYDVDFPFETDMPVPQQKQAIAQFAGWIKNNSSRFQDGKWYFAGKLMQ